MALIPIYGRFVGDFTAHMVVVDTDDTIDEVATARGWAASRGL